ncbi:type IV secretion system protein, partial [Paraburkholderia azotifigens]|uniref:type IV secretion system protein n=1 Tax=Paraburkholderia azotifigens TaxID=2057004 RepID=UPI0031774B83
ASWSREATRRPPVDNPRLNTQRRLDRIKSLAANPSVEPGQPQTDITGTMVDAIGLLLAFIVILIASIVFAYFSAVGQIQAAVGIVLGPIAISLGFSSYTRNYFMRWLDWMIHSGMYVVMVAVLVKLVGANIANAVSKATPASGATVTGAYAFDLAVFVLLLAFEIPKLAGMFGSGAGATGTGALKLAKSFIP